MTRATSHYLNHKPRSLVSALIDVAKARKLSFREAHDLVTPPCEIVNFQLARAVRDFRAVS